jgi:NAD synthase
MTSTRKGNNRKRSKNFGFVRVGTATPKLRVGNPDFNAREIVSVMASAEKQRTAVLFFPELALTGYTCADLFHQRILIEASLRGLETVRKATEDGTFTGITFVGLPVMHDDVLFNVVVGISKGEILGCVPKTFLVNNAEFYEWRWFAPAGSEVNNEIVLCGQKVPFSPNILFACADMPGLKIAIEVCEDGWSIDAPSTQHALFGATVIGNDSASPEKVGQAGFRRQLFGMRSATLLCVYAYCSSGVHESTTDLVFGGDRFIFENGSMIKQGKRFERESGLTIADVDLQRIAAERMRVKNFADSRRLLKVKPTYVTVHFRLGDRPAPERLERHVEAHPFVPGDSAELADRCEDIFSIQTAGLAKRVEGLYRVHVPGCKRSTCACTGMRTNGSLQIGVSGGLDSTLALLVACRMVDLLGLPRTVITGTTMPGFGTTKRTKANAITLMAELGIRVDPEYDIRWACLEGWRQRGHRPFGRIDIPALYKTAEAEFKGENAREFTIDAFRARVLALFEEELQKLPAGSQDLVFENDQARERTEHLMNKGFVLGTGDLSELAIGWCTYNADHMSMYNVNASIPKTLVQFLVKWVAKTLFSGATQVCLLDIADTEISPELLPVGKDGQIAQKTESVVGPYELHDFFLYNLVRYGYEPEKVIYLAEQSNAEKDFFREHTSESIRKWLATFIQRFFRNQFKRSCLPDGPKVGSVCLSPRGDWRMPSDADESIWLLWADEHAESTNNGGSSGRDRTSQMSTTINTTDKVKEVVFRVLCRVDEQNDFMPTGSLPVPKGDEVISVNNTLARSGFFDVVIHTQDDHPADHGSFASQHAGKNPYDKIELNGVDQVLWPDHCVHGTKGWEFHPDVDTSLAAKIFPKGQDKRVDSYSGLFDNGRRADKSVLAAHPYLGKATGAVEWVNAQARAKGATRVEFYSTGLTPPFCPTFTALDATEQTLDGTPWDVFLFEDGVRTLEAICPHDAAMQQLRDGKVKVIHSSEVLPKVAAE